MNNIIAFEGPDICGKSTMINMVKKELKKDGIKKIGYFKFPDYDGVSGSEYGKKVKDMLHSDIKNFDDEKFVVEYARTQLMDKYTASSYIKKECKKFDVYIMDRFLLSPLVYDIVFFHGIWPEEFDFSLPVSELVDKCLEKYGDIKDKAVELMESFKDSLYIVIDKPGSKGFLHCVINDDRNTDVVDKSSKQKDIETMYDEFNKQRSSFHYISNVTTISYDGYLAKHKLRYLKSVVSIIESNMSFAVAFAKLQELRSDTIEAVNKICCETVTKIIRTHIGK